jgi:cyclase
MSGSPLRVRIVGVVIVRGGWTVQSIGFRRYLPVGRPEIAVEYLNRWGIDEIILLDIDATANGRSPDIAAVERYARIVQVPLAVGGGIRTLNDVERLVRAGADKVILNHAAVHRPTLLTEASHVFGRQCIIASIDARRVGDRYEAFTSGGREPTGLTAEEWAVRCRDLGAGEIFLASIDRDGAQSGFDTELAARVVRAVNVPVVICGGAGHPDHFAEAAATGVSGVAAGNMLHFTEHSVIVIKRHLTDIGLPVRLDSYTDYAGFRIDARGRIARQSDDYLDRIRFEYIPEEVI